MSIPVFTTPAQRTCRGRAGQSKAHPHYAGRAQVYVPGHGYVSRCTSCDQVVAIKQGDPAGVQLVEVTPEFALAFVAAAI